VREKLIGKREARAAQRCVVKAEAHLEETRVRKSGSNYRDVVAAEVLRTEKLN